MTRDDYIAKAPTTKGHGPDAVAVVKEVARGLFPFFSCMVSPDGINDFSRVAVFMNQKWSRHCDPPWDSEKLFEIVEEASTAFQAETAAEAERKAAEERAARQRAKARAEAEHKATEARRARESVVGLAKHIGVSERQTRYILRDGTTLREQAEKIAEFRGGTPEDYLRVSGRRGRKRDLVGWFMEVAAAEGYSWRAFVDDDDYDPEARDDAAAALITLFRDGKVQDDFADLEELLESVRALGHTAEAGQLAWKEFKLWRVGQVAAAARYDVDD